eukprot:2462891-Rhodomonas_salina.1
MGKVGRSRMTQARAGAIAMSVMVMASLAPSLSSLALESLTAVSAGPELRRKASPVTCEEVGTMSSSYEGHLAALSKVTEESSDLCCGVGARAVSPRDEMTPRRAVRFVEVPEDEP